MKIIKLAKQLYGNGLVLSKGICYGIAFAAIDKFLHGTFEIWSSVHKFIRNYTGSDLLRDILNARYRAICKETPLFDDQNLLCVHAFFDEAILLQSGPRQAKDLYPENTTNLQDYRATNELLYMDQVDRLHLCHEQIRLDCDRSFTSLLYIMQRLKNDYNLAYTISFVGHRIAIFPSIDEISWTIVDHDLVFTEISPVVIFSYLSSKHGFIIDAQDSYSCGLLPIKLNVYSLSETYFLDVFKNNLELSQYISMHNHARNIKGDHLTHIAIKFKSHELIQQLLTLGFSLTEKNKMGFTLLHSAVLNNAPNIIEYLAKYIDVSSRDNYGATPLHLAVRLNLPTSVGELFTCGSDINKADFYGNTPLHCAAFTGNFNMFKLLLKQGANPSLVNKSGVNLLHFAVIGQNKAMFKYILDNFYKDYDVSTLSDNKGNTLLHFLGNIEISQSLNLSLLEYMLSDLNLDINSINHRGETPLYLASQSGLNDLVLFLLARGASLDLVNKNGLTPLHVAAAAGRLSVVKSILSFNFGVLDFRSNNGRTALHFASKNNNIEIVEYLLFHQSFFDPIDIYGRTPLFLAIDNEADVKIIDYLLARGANINSKDKNNITVERLVQLIDNQKITEAFKRHTSRCSPTTVTDVISIFDSEEPSFRCI